MLLSSLKKYAPMCGLSVRTLRRLCQQGELPATKIGNAYYVDTQAADQALRESVKRFTARKNIPPDILSIKPKKRSFDFMAEIERLKKGIS